MVEVEEKEEEEGGGEGQGSGWVGGLGQRGGGVRKSSSFSSSSSSSSWVRWEEEVPLGGRRRWATVVGEEEEGCVEVSSFGCWWCPSSSSWVAGAGRFMLSFFALLVGVGVGVCGRKKEGGRNCGLGGHTMGPLRERCGWGWVGGWEGEMGVGGWDGKERRRRKRRRSKRPHSFSHTQGTFWSPSDGALSRGLLGAGAEGAEAWVGHPPLLWGDLIEREGMGWDEATLVCAWRMRDTPMLFTEKTHTLLSVCV